MIVPFQRQDARYPDSDGQPMADNTLQFEWISTLKWGCEVLFADRPDVFVAGDHLIYPVQLADEDDTSTPVRIAPDVYVAFGRPKGYRGTYKVWEEGGVFPQVVFEVWSPNNGVQEMERKRAFYARYGAEEYYLVYPEVPAHVDGWVRQGNELVEIEDMKSWVSPRLGIRFHLHRGKLTVFRPDGKRFLTPVEQDEQMRLALQRAEQETKRAEQEVERAAQASQRAAAAAAERDAERERAARLAEKLRQLGVDPDSP